MLYNICVKSTDITSCAALVAALVKFLNHLEILHLTALQNREFCARMCNSGGKKLVLSRSDHISAVVVSRGFCCSSPANPYACISYNFDQLAACRKLFLETVVIKIAVELKSH